MKTRHRLIATQQASDVRMERNLTTNTHSQVAGDEPERFRVMGADEWRQPAPPMRWDVAGVWPEGSHGPIAGAKKSMKTYTTMDLALSLAAGVPFLGHFPVPSAKPVLYLLGEGGRTPGRRRFERIAEAKGVNAAELVGDGMLSYIYDAAPVDSDTFLDPVRRHMYDYQPGLVVLDSLYAFHPPLDNVGNLYERGAMLARLGQEFEGVSLVLNDHFNKSSPAGLDLDSIAQSGMAAWANSWALLAHREDPRVDDGEFRLSVQFGGREWGGSQYNVDWCVGRFDPETGMHDGSLTVSVLPATWDRGRATGSSVDYEARIEDYLREHPYESNRTEVLAGAKGKEAPLRDALDRLIASSQVGEKSVPGVVGEDGKKRSKRVLGMQKLSLSAATSRPEGQE